MIQQICLTRHKKQEGWLDFNQPLELIVNARDYRKFEKLIAILFDTESVERIKKIKAQLD